MPESSTVHPIIGARRPEQISDSLGAADLFLPADIAQRLDATTGFELGFPHDFIAGMQTFVFGQANSLVED